MKTLNILLIPALYVCLPTQPAQAATIFLDRPSFEATLGALIVDDYSAPGYSAGDNFNSPGSIHGHTNASMNAVLGETEYFTTGFNNWNLIDYDGATPPRYCAGCNGSFRLSFLNTSLSDPGGVFGAGFDVQENDGTYVAFVTFGDSSTEEHPLAIGFFGITSPLSISSIHVGLTGGQSTTGGNMAIDNLTIGSRAAAVPEPGTASLLAAGLAAAMCWRRRRRA